VQLWYQMALHGRRDLGYAPSPRAGFEMAMLRMLAFRPADGGATTVDAPAANAARGPAAARAALDASAAASTPPPARTLPASAMQNPARETANVAPPPRSMPEPLPMSRTPEPRVESASAHAGTAPPATEIDNERWLDLVARSGLRGPARELAAHAAFLGYADGVLRLSLSPDDDHLRAPALLKALTDAMSSQLGGPVQIKLDSGKPAQIETLHQRNERQRDAKQAAAEDAFLAHPDVQRLMTQQGAKLVPDSIRPYED
nr:DNA polymerase III subunit gamma/tau [Xanthomonadaceae bacterium]